METIVELIDDEVPEWALDKAPDFFESVRKGAVDISETITQMNDVTAAQQSALDNWEAGVRRWIRK